ncbi:hypothetical protein [Glaciecola sp. KUL10]|uniref:hypothetical protein n=1 Tax=Glaciecola sp. (strain KUL10) TaxID=2161813 RepID=UPI000D9FBAD4|nr:hypothetical protein [Glaciecola sp. KUL10]GBL02827.1 lipoprotein [Glaciecola sp. KUL10]
MPFLFKNKKFLPINFYIKDFVNKRENTIKNLLIKLTIITGFLFGIAACDDSPNREIRAGKYGMMSEESPQYAAIVFLLTIYENENLDETISMTSQSFGRTIKAYHTNKSVQRHLLNLRLDKVEIEPMSGGFSPRNEFTKKSTVDLKITGYFNNEKIIDLRTIEMVKKGGDWQIIGVRNTVP